MPVPLMTTDKENRQIAKQFRDFRRKNKLSQAELARLMEVTSRTIGNVERASNGISVTLMRRFSEVQRLAAANRKAGKAMRIPR